MSPSYLFTSSRLGFRLWQDSDLPSFSAMNADAETMRYFDKSLTEEESKAMMDRLNRTFAEKGYCYFAVDQLDSGDFVGMIGLGWKTFEADFTPCVDIGWRLARPFWNHGFATEGAIRCLDFARAKNITEVYSYASKSNLASLRIMTKIGLKYLKDFDHPDLNASSELNPCSLYSARLKKKMPPPNGDDI